MFSTQYILSMFYVFYDNYSIEFKQNPFRFQFTCMSFDVLQIQNKVGMYTKHN